MKILILSWYFPPVNTIGALRVGKFARFLVERGHEIGVVAGVRWGHPETLPVDVPRERLAYAEWFDVNALPGGVSRLLRGGSAKTKPVVQSEAPAEVPPASTHQGKSALRRLTDFYVNVTNFPDDRVGWLPQLYRRTIEVSRHWRPDLIFASGPPFTALVGGHLASKRLGVPWVAELRDRWADDPYYQAPPWRLKLEHRFERWTLGSASGLVTVTEPWAEFYREKYGKPVATIYNGYDPVDFDVPLAPAPPSPHLVIGYAGRIYPGRRDPAPLFQALRLLGSEADEIRVVFCGTDPGHVWPIARRANVEHLVEVRLGVPYRESLEFQRRSDVLLLMQWNDPREQGNCPGKFFEYLASLRPVLILGLKGGVPDTIARSRGAGVCSNDPSEIAAQLRLWLQEKRNYGRVKELPLSAREGLSRTLQFERLESFFETLPARQT